MARHGHGYHAESAKQIHAGVLELDGWFYPNGVSAPTSFNKAIFKSVVWDATGVWTCTLLDTKFPVFTRLLGLQVSARNNAACNITRPGVFSLTGKTFKVENFDATGAAQDIAAHADSRVNVKITLKVSPVNDGSELA
jgi:hypothetical protein